MRILLLSHMRNDKNAGASRIFHVLQDGLSAGGHTVRTLHYDDFEPVRFPRIQRAVDKLALPHFISFRAAHEASSGYDAILASNGSAYPLFRRLRRNPARPLLVNHLHGLTVFDRQADLNERVLGRQRLSFTYRALTGPLASAWDAMGSRYADLTIVQNERDYDYLLRSGLEPDRLARITPGVYPEIMLASAGAPPPQARPPAALLWFGSWTARKGIHALPAAFDLILDDVPEARLTIGGVGRPAAEILSSFSARAAGRVRVLPKISLDEQLAEFGRHAIFLFPSLSEGYGLALVEAMALGLAAVTTDTGVGGDALCHRENALIVPKASALHLARATVALIRDGALRHTIARNGQALARTFSTQRMIESYELAFLTFQSVRS